MNDVSIASRFAMAEAWWIIHQLVSRNPELKVTQQADLIDGEVLILDLEDSATFPLEIRSRLRVVLGQDGISLLSPQLFRPLPWSAIFGHEDPMATVRMLERSVGLEPATGEAHEIEPRTLTYALFAKVLACLANGREEWYLKSVGARGWGIDKWSPMDLTQFPSLTDSAIDDFQRECTGESPIPREPLWFLFRNQTVVAAFDEGAGFHLHGQCFQLRQAYMDVGCKIDVVAAQVTIGLLG